MQRKPANCSRINECEGRRTLKSSLRWLRWCELVLALYNVVISTRLQVWNVCALTLRAGSKAFLAPRFKTRFHLKTETGGYLKPERWSMTDLFGAEWNIAAFEHQGFIKWTSDLPRQSLRRLLLTVFITIRNSWLLHLLLISPRTVIVYKIAKQAKILVLLRKKSRIQSYSNLICDC